MDIIGRDKIGNRFDLGVKSLPLHIVESEASDTV